MSYNSGVIVLVISNHPPHYSLNCTPLSPVLPLLISFIYARKHKFILRKKTELPENHEINNNIYFESIILQ